MWCLPYKQTVRCSPNLLHVVLTACIMPVHMLVCVNCRAATPSFRLSRLKLPVKSSLGDRQQVSHRTDSPLQRIHSSPNRRSLSAAVIRLRKAELVQEMQLRGLPETGSRHELRERLLAAVQAEQRLTSGLLHLLQPLLSFVMSLHKLKSCDALHRCWNLCKTGGCLARQPQAPSTPATICSIHPSWQEQPITD